MPTFINTSDYVSPIARAASHHVQSGGSQEGLLVIAKAIALAEALEDRQPDDLESVRESVRRAAPVETAELFRLRDIATRIAKESESYLNQYALAEFVQASAVGSADVASRNELSIASATAAEKFGRFERARACYGDALEGLQIVRRFAVGDREIYARAEEEIRRHWDGVRSRYPGQPDLLDPATADPADDWESLLIWNTDQGNGHGVIAQADATLRLAIRLEHWSDARGQEIAPIVAGISERLIARAKNGEDWLALRCRFALGDALMEISQWHLACEVHEAATRQAEAEGQNVIALHGIAQSVCCDLMAGERDRASTRLASLNWPMWEATAKRIVSVAADVARLVAARGAMGLIATKEAAATVKTLLEMVALIATDQPKQRLEYLRSIYAAIVNRDVVGLTSVNGER